MPAPGPLRLLGLDPGLLRTGWGVIEVRGNRLTYVADAPTELRLADERLGEFVTRADLVEDTSGRLQMTGGGSRILRQEQLA